jgi:hypothetical protein
MPPLQRSNRGGRARTRRDVAVPDAVRSLRARNNTPRGHDWTKRRLMGFLFCRGSNLQPQFQVFREPSNAYRFRLKRTATYTSAGRVAHRCGRARIAPVGSIVICDCSAPLFFSYGRDRRPDAEPSMVLLLRRTVSTWPLDGADCCRVAFTGYSID